MAELHALPHALPAEMGVDPKALLALLDAVEEQRIGLHGLVVVRHGSIVAQGWWKPYSPALTHMLFSLSKSFTSTAVGFCVQEGLLTVEDRAVDFFPEKLPFRPCENMEKLRIRHLLTMSTGHQAEPAVEKEEDWAEAFLTSYLPLEPGSRFLYNTPATYLLSAIVQKVTGLTTGEYLQPRLFEPLGIEGWWWEHCPKGIHTGGFGLNLHTGDIARFGQFLLQKGVWEGRQLLDSRWIEAATTFQVQNLGERDWGAGYGYQFWMCTPGSGAYRGDGAFGQLCVVLPAYDMVIAVNAGLDDIQQELDAFWEHLLPGVHGEALPADPAAQTELSRRLCALQITPPEGMSTCETAEIVSGAVYELSDNLLGIRTISLTFGEAPGVTFRYGEQEITCGIGYGEWQSAETGLSCQAFSPQGRTFFRQLACAGAWEAGEYLLDIAHTTTPFIDHYRFSFDENALVFTMLRGVAQKEPYRLIGRRISSNAF